MVRYEPNAMAGNRLEAVGPVDVPDTDIVNGLLEQVTWSFLDQIALGRRTKRALRQGRQARAYWLASEQLKRLASRLAALRTGQ